MKKKLSRRDFLKIVGIGTAATVPGALGYEIFRSAQGEEPVKGSPYVANQLSTNLDGSLPILLIVNHESPNPFGIYLGEILRAEGINCFHTAELSNIQSGSLEKYAVVVLAETPLSNAQAEIFRGYVARGGRLISMKPDERLGEMFGLERSVGSLSEGYLKMEPEYPASEGINSSSLQYHGSANLYPLAGAQSVAWLYKDRETSTQYPAITFNQVNNGMAFAFAFDLAKSIVYMRQGNPESSNQEHDGHPFIRATAMIVGWLDLERIGIQQADEQQRLFVKLIYELSQTKIPLPRLWYFPGHANALLVATGDAHPMSGGETINNVLTRVESFGGHMSIYYSFILHDDLYRFAQRGRFYAGKLPVIGEMLEEHYKTPTPDQVANWRARGHEFTVHPHVGSGTCGGFSVNGPVTFNHLEDGWKVYWRQFTGLGYGPVSNTVRTHCVLWQGWAETARLQANYGIRMNLDYYHVGPAFRKKNGEWAYGYFTGSGLPMRFMDEHGHLLDIYQQLTQLADEHFFSFPEISWIAVGNYTSEAALEVATGLMDSSLANNSPAAFCFQFHTDPFAYGGSPAEIAGKWLKGTLEYAVQKGIPIWSAKDWLEFTQLRNGVSYSSIKWDDKTQRLEFLIQVQPKSKNTAKTELALMLPAKHGNAHLTSIMVDGSPVNLVERKINNVNYGWAPVFVGDHKVVAQFS